MPSRMPARQYFARQGKRIRFVDGFAIRNSFPDFDVIESDATSGVLVDGRRAPHIPKGEIWIDACYADEDDLLLEAHRMELRLRRLPYPQVRKSLIETLCDTDGRLPPFYRLGHRRINGMKVRLVKGSIIRRYFDPGFIFGGHDLVYTYVTPGEVWIDDVQDPREIEFTILHELHERQLMHEGWTYADAHRSATDVEFEARRRWRVPRLPHDMRPFRQSEAFCGPASLKIVCDLHGRDYDEAYLAGLCGSTRLSGTDHAGLIAAVKTLGGQSYAKSGGTLDEIADLLSDGVPVIVGWYSPSTPRKCRFDPQQDDVEDHFSVVRRVTATHVELMDPEVENGRKRITRKRFERLWWDTDGHDDEHVDRWFLAIRFDGLEFTQKT